MLPTLYIYDSKGRARQWSVATDGPTVIVTHGLVDGKKTEKRTTSKAKNIGKVNETTPEQQAELDAKSKWNQQVQRDDYHEDIDKAGKQLRAMLAKDLTKASCMQTAFDKHLKNQFGNVAIQNKLNGVRLTAGNRSLVEDGPFEFMTRKGDTYQVPHLERWAQRMLEVVNDLLEDKDYKCIALDGELYIHGMELRNIVSRARRLRDETLELQYHIFDLVIPGMPFTARHLILQCAYQFMVQETKANLLNFEDDFQLVNYKLIKTMDQMKAEHGAAIEGGHEGLILRNPDGMYLSGDRPSCMMKYKEFYDKECKIIDVWEDLNGNAMWTCLWDHNDPTTEFNCTPKRTHSERKKMLRNKEKYIDQWATIKYQELSFANHEGGLPLFASGLGLRECDEDGNPIV